MSDDAIRSLRKQLERKQEQLDLIAALDDIRDDNNDPSAMLSAIVNLLTEHFNADLCLLSLVNRDTGEVQLKAVNDRGDYLTSLGADALHDLSERAVKLNHQVDVWNGADALNDEAAASLHIAAVPIIMGEGVRLGSVLMARADQAFTHHEQELLKVIEDQIDSAVVQGHSYVELQLRNKELQTIYRVDRIRDEDMPLDEMLNTVLTVIREAIQAEMGFIMLYDQAGDRLEMRAVTHDDLFRTSDYQDVVNRVAYDALKKAHLIFENNLAGGVNSIMCVPLIMHDEILGVFGVVNRYGPRGFDERDRILLNAIASQIDTAIFEDLEQRRLRQVLGRSVDPRVMERLLSNPDVDFLKGERMTLTVLFADIRQSTALAEKTDPGLLVGFVNDYLGRMAEVILNYEGTLDKFVGDEVMALFGAPFPMEDHALRAVRVALEMIEVHEGIMDKWREQGVDTEPIGIGIATGEGTVGEMGSALRTDYTVIGRPANLGARLCGVAGGSQVLVSQSTYDLIKDEVNAEQVRGVSLKGIGEDVTAYRVLSIKGE